MNWLIPGTDIALLNVHEESPDCQKGCLIHKPTTSHPINVEGWPYVWRAEKHSMERTCPHGVGHPDPDEALYQDRAGRPWKNIHGCDGCCMIR